MKDTTQALIIGLVVAFVGGFIVGAYRSNPLPANYDPSRAITVDALREANAATERCWRAAMAARAK